LEHDRQRVDLFEAQGWAADDLVLVGAFGVSDPDRLTCATGPGQVEGVGGWGGGDGRVGESRAGLELRDDRCLERRIGGASRHQPNPTGDCNSRARRSFTAFGRANAGNDWVGVSNSSTPPTLFS